jgi:hypothetical protein
MLDNWFKRGRKALTARRITGISTPVGGVQFAPVPDTSFTRAQDERELRHEIWLLAVGEAYIAKDGVRRMQQMQGKSELQLVEDYLAEIPEIRRWLDRNIEAGTCAAAITELREKKERLRQARLEQPRA